MTKNIELLSASSQKSLQTTSMIRQIFLLGQRLRESNPNVPIIDLSLGNPDLEPPPEVQQGLKQLAGENVPGVHRYMDNAGFPEVREKLAAHLSRAESVSISRDSVFLTCGAAGALHILFRSLLDPGDEVVLLAPYFVEYQTYVAVHQGRCRCVELDFASGFIPTMASIDACLNERTKLLVLNSPNNPSGIVYPESFFRDLEELLFQHAQKMGRVVQVVSDEPYAHVLFRGRSHTSVLRLMQNCWLVRSHSKDLGLAGERIGYIAWKSDESDTKVLDALRASSRALGFVNAPAMMQRLLPLVFGASVQTSIYEERSEAFCEILLKGGLELHKPGGTFFVLPRVPEGFDEKGFCEQLAAKGVLVVPASGFGAPGFFRVSLTQDLVSIKQAAHEIVALSKISKM